MSSSSHKLFRIAAVVLRLGLGAVFGYAAWVKLREPWMLFAISVDAYHVLPEWGAVAVARTLPWFELALAVMLLTGIGKRISLPAASALLAVFFGLMVRSYARGEGIDCGCFGPGEAISPITLLRDGGLLAASLLLSVLAFRPLAAKRGDSVPVLSHSPAPVGNPQAE
ncbi:MAG TPA: MauE/DoxX family redox-associated membrane protein [Bryobacteraceae bacterium]|nr:MauE/DoxX family redox-associated membrane protein [Bryobacteraceae bacterium]